MIALLLILVLALGGTGYFFFPEKERGENLSLFVGSTYLYSSYTGVSVLNALSICHSRLIGWEIWEVLSP